MNKPLVVIAGLLAATAAQADLQVSYDVELKSFKQRVAAGDTLTFDLYTSPDCTGSFSSSTNFVAGSDDLEVEEVKPLAVKGQRPKPKKLARLSARLSTGAASIPFSLLVSGSDGPLAGCQAQTPAAARLPSPLWITAYEFGELSDSTGWFHSSAGDVASTDAGRECMQAPIRLPDGAILTRFDAYLRDSDPAESIDVKLFRNPLEDSPRTELALGSSVDQPGRQIVTGDVTVGPIVENEQFHYYVEFCFGGAAVGFGGHGVWAVAVHFE